MGPRSSGKTALLRKVCSNLSKDEPACPLLYLDGRAEQLYNTGVLKKTLQRCGSSALSQLSERLAVFPDSSLGRAVVAVTGRGQVASGNFSISRAKMISAFLKQDDQTIEDVITMCTDTLALYNSAKSSNSSWPIICINFANVLTEGTLEDRGALQALLRFFVKVSVCAEPTT